MKILIADDHPMILEGLSKVLSLEGHDVRSARSAAEAIRIFSDEPKIHLAIVDLYLGSGECGLDVINRLREINPDVRTVIYTMYDDNWNISRILRSDVDGVALKGESIHELTAAVSAVSAGGSYMSADFKTKAEAMKNSRAILSDLDMKVLQMISDGKNTSAIASAVCLTEKSVEYHRKNIMKKFDAKNMTEAIKNAVRLGIIGCAAAAISSPAYAQEMSAPEIVDLGLSVNWADRNLGAPSPLDDGGYYAFGETEVKEIYNWETYSLCDNANLFQQHNIGETTICGTKYDAATKHLGPDWRLPTVEEIEELIENCTVTFFEAEGDGYSYSRFTAANGAYIDFPITGYMNNGRIVAEGFEGVLHSGSFYVEAGEEDGFKYYLNSPYNLAALPNSDPLIIEGTSFLGLQIRPVTASQASALDVIAPATASTAVYSIGGCLMGSDIDALPSGVYILLSGGKAVKVMK